MMPIHNIPVLLATRLHLELLLSERAIDLGEVASVLRNDLGATLAVFARYADEVDGPIPERLEECLAGLRTETWLDAVSCEAVERIGEQHGGLDRLLAFWERGRLLAHAAWYVAHVTRCCAPETSYLVGLLHELAALPELLENPACSPSFEAFRGSVPSGVWRLPPAVAAVLEATSLPPHWSSLLEQARAWSRGDICFQPID